MHCLKSDRWKTGIALAGMLLLLVLTLWVSVSAADAHERVSESATNASIVMQATPTVDATVTALSKEKLQHENDWWWNYGATILTSLISTLTLAAAGVFTVVRYFNDRRDTREKQDEEQQHWLENQEAEREKRAEERFQAAVEGLSSEREEAKIGAAILLRTFLRPGYEEFYTQTFDLAVAHLRLPRIPHTAEDANTTLPHQLAESYPTTLRQALITVFRESFPLARDEWMESREDEDEKFDPQSLDATGIRLDNAYLVEADLKQVWLRQAYLRNVDLRWAKLDYAYLRGAYLREAHLRGAHLRGAILRETDLREALVHEADLREVRLWGADLSNANLSNTDLSKADLSNGTNLIANLSGVDLSNANLSNANLDRTNIASARSLKDTDLRGVKGLTKEQLEACKAKGAIIDEDTTTNPPQSPVSASPPEPHNEA